MEEAHSRIDSKRGSAPRRGESRLGGIAKTRRLPSALFEGAPSDAPAPTKEPHANKETKYSKTQGKNVYKEQGT